MRHILKYGAQATFLFVMIGGWGIMCYIACKIGEKYDDIVNNRNNAHNGNNCGRAISNNGNGRKYSSGR